MSSVKEAKANEVYSCFFNILRKTKCYVKNNILFFSHIFLGLLLPSEYFNEIKINQNFVCKFFYEISSLFIIFFSFYIYARANVVRKSVSHSVYGDQSMLVWCPVEVSQSLLHHRNASLHPTAR